MKRCIRALMIATLVLSLCCSTLAESSADDPVVVRVGDFTYTRSQLQRSLDSTLELSEMLRGDAPSDEEKAARLEATIESFVGLGVIENKLAEAGKNDYSEAEMVRRHRRERDADRQRRGDADRARQGAHRRQQQPAAVRRHRPGCAGTALGVAQAFSERREIKTRRKPRPSPAAAAAD